MDYLSNDHKTRPNQPKNSCKLCDETGHPLENVGKSMETETTTSKLHIGGKAIVEQILASEERNKSKRAGL